MPRLFYLSISCFFVIFASAVSAQSSLAQLTSPFRSDQYTPDELRLIQLGLGVSGDYNGILDGKWGAISAKALTSYSFREFAEAPKTIHLGSIALKAVEFLESSKWEILNFSDPNFSILIPTENRTNLQESRDYFSFSHGESSLNYSITFGGLDKTLRYHDFAINEAANPSATYSVRKKDRLVTSIEKRDGQLLYVRSDFASNIWTTVLLSAYPKDRVILNVVAGSIRFNKRYDFNLPENGKLADTIKTLVNIATEPKRPGTAAPSERHLSSNNLIATGSGYLVSDRGQILTNAHVIEGCRRLKVGGSDAALQAQSEIFDLALLHSPNMTNQAPLKFSPKTIALNQDLIIAGFPYSDLLSGLNITRGNVSSITGIKGDNINFQISAPVQSGNSGGPALDEYGAAIGTVVAKLSPKATGSRPENVNFAVRNEIALLFLSQNQVEVQFSNNQEALSAQALGALASDVTVKVECYD